MQIREICIRRATKEFHELLIINEMSDEIQHQGAGDLSKEAFDIRPDEITCTGVCGSPNQGHRMFAPAILDPSDTCFDGQDVANLRQVLKDIENCSLNDTVLDGGDHERACLFARSALWDALLRTEFETVVREVILYSVQLACSDRVELTDLLSRLIGERVQSVFTYFPPCLEQHGALAKDLHKIPRMSDGLQVGTHRIAHPTAEALPWLDRDDAFPSGPIVDGAFTSSAEPDAQGGLGQR